MILGAAPCGCAMRVRHAKMISKPNHLSRTARAHTHVRSCPHVAHTSHHAASAASQGTAQCVPSKTAKQAKIGSYFSIQTPQEKLQKLAAEAEQRAGQRRLSSEEEEPSELQLQPSEQNWRLSQSSSRRSSSRRIRTMSEPRREQQPGGVRKVVGVAGTSHASAIQP